MSKNTSSAEVNPALDRRAVLVGGMAWAGIAALAGAAVHGGGAWAGAGEEAGEPFTADLVKKLAETLAQSDFVRPAVELAEPFNALTAEQYREIRFRPDQEVWRGEKVDAELQLLPMGWIYDVPVEIWLVDGGKARALKADGKMFSFGAMLEKAPEAAPYGFSGFRVKGPLNRADTHDEYLSFQGASYFKAVGRGQTFGISARGLAINTARAGGEEFPIFRAFWIERPRSAGAEIVVYALLDSPSTAGAYRFVVRPGATTSMDVDATLFPRKALSHVGIAPLTSMFLNGSTSQRMRTDYRPSVHNSEGLAVLNGNGERLWRPLTNPKKLETSAFIDKDPKGFGLCQRTRSFQAYEDLDQHFELRPTVWVEPKGSWGEGYIELIEIPVSEEIHDNIVAYWKPAKELEPGTPSRYAYRLHWGSDIPVAWSGARAVRTMIVPGKAPDSAVFVIDFEGPALKDARELPLAEYSVSAGSVSNLVVQRHPEIGGLRVKFDLNTAGNELVELRLALKQGEQAVSENWLYRWTKP